MAAIATPVISTSPARTSPLVATLELRIREHITTELADVVVVLVPTAAGDPRTLVRLGAQRTGVLAGLRVRMSDAHPTLTAWFPAAESLIISGLILGHVESEPYIIAAFNRRAVGARQCRKEVALAVGKRAGFGGVHRQAQLAVELAAVVMGTISIRVGAVVARRPCCDGVCQLMGQVAFRLDAAWSSLLVTHGQLRLSPQWCTNRAEIVRWRFMDRQLGSNSPHRALLEAQGWTILDQVAGKFAIRDVC
jgi:hypothetical protein